MARKQTIFDVISTGDPARVRRKLARDPAALGERDENGLSPVMRALYEAKPDIVDVLLEKGAELDLFEAAALGRTELLGKLVGRSKRRAGGYSSDGFTPLHLAAFFGHPKVAELLLANAADATARSRNSTGNTPLHAALAANQKLVAGLLIGSGADLNAADAAGWRPLHLAAANNSVDVMKTLIAQGADVSVNNGDGLTALALAEKRNHREAAALLQRHGAA